MQYIAESKFIRISPRKVRHLANEVKKLRINDALLTLSFSPKKGGLFIKRTLDSAIANAKNNFKVQKDDLVIKSIDITQGPFFKRWRAVSRGASHQYKKRTSHIRVILERIKPIPEKVNVRAVKEKKDGTKS